MTNTHDAVVSAPPAKVSALRYFSRVRLQDILVLQGPPLLGAAFAIRQPRMHDLAALTVLLIANVSLVAHIFILNDWSGLTVDQTDPNKASHVFTARGVGRREVGALAAAFLILSLVFFSALGIVTFSLALGIVSLSALYSLPRFHWKGRPLLNSFTHLSGGILHFLLGYSVGSAVGPRGVAIAAFFGLVFTAGHLNQEIRDYAGDALNRVSTNAVVFGQRRTFSASLLLFAAAQVLLLLLAIDAILPRPLALLVALFPLQLWWSWQTLREGLTFESVSRLQSRYRLLYAVIGVAMVATLVT